MSGKNNLSKTIRAIGSAISLLLLMALFSCRPSVRVASSDTVGDTLRLRYARNLQMIQYDGYMEAIVRNPWDTTHILRRYILLQGGECPKDFAREATLVTTPLRRAAVFTSVHCALLEELGCTDAIGGICELQYIHLPFVHRGVANGTIADLGNGMNPNVERIMQLQPDALLPTPFENSGGYGRMERIGIPIVECADYMEPSPLARAEWIRFYGRLFGRNAEADSLFQTIEQRYRSLCHQAETADHRPRMICEIPQSGYWYLPGGQSTMGQLYRDAGADYLFSDLPGAGSTSLSVERVLDRALTAEVWLMKHSGLLTREQVFRDYPALRHIPAQTWFCNIAENNYYEETPFHPERLLANIVHILHPELELEDVPTYFVPME